MSVKRVIDWLVRHRSTPSEPELFGVGGGRGVRGHSDWDRPTRPSPRGNVSTRNAAQRRHQRAVAQLAPAVALGPGADYFRFLTT